MLSVCLIGYLLFLLCLETQHDRQVFYHWQKKYSISLLSFLKVCFFYIVSSLLPSLLTSFLSSLHFSFPLYFLFLSPARYLCWFSLFLVISASICWILPVLSTSSSFFTKFMVSNFILYWIFFGYITPAFEFRPLFWCHRYFTSIIYITKCLKTSKIHIPCLLN